MVLKLFPLTKPLLYILMQNNCHLPSKIVKKYITKFRLGRKILESNWIKFGNHCKIFWYRKKRSKFHTYFLELTYGILTKMKPFVFVLHAAEFELLHTRNTFLLSFLQFLKIWKGIGMDVGKWQRENFYFRQHCFANYWFKKICTYSSFTRYYHSSEQCNSNRKKFF